MKFLFLFLLLSFISSAQAVRICYFSLNNTAEFTEMEKFTHKLNKRAKVPIEVQEFMTKGDNASDAFEEMVKSGVECDGLVISGHHTGSFGGENASSNLDVSFMEKISCHAKYEKFFSKIKALWLQGCRTLGVGKIETYDTADFHTDRVGAVLQEDHLTQSFADLNMEFSATLDQDNPLSSRYLRIFPRATVFGWTKTAPGIKAQSQFSLPFHIAHIAHLNDDRKRYFDHPAGNLSEDSAAKYSLAILDLVGKAGDNSQECSSDRNESNFVQAWKEHGTPNEGNKYFFSNPDLNAYVSMLKGGDKSIQKAKELDCLLKKSLTGEEAEKILHEILKDESLIGYNFNSIYELIQRFMESGDVESLTRIRTKLGDSQELNHFLMRKLSSNELGILRRIDYYMFWKSMTNKSNEGIEQKIQDVYVAMILKQTKEDDYAANDFKSTLTQSLTKHDLVTSKMLHQIVKSPKVDSYSLRGVALIIRDSKTPIEGSSEMLREIVKSPKAGVDAFQSVTLVIENSKTRIEGSSEILREIVKSPKGDSYSLGRVAFVIGDSQIPIEGSSEILREIVKSPKADSFVLQGVAFAIGNSETAFEGSSEILLEIAKSPKADTYVLQSVALAILASKTPIKGALEIIQEIEKRK